MSIYRFLNYPPSDDGGPIEANVGFGWYCLIHAPIRRLMTAALLKRGH